MFPQNRSSHRSQRPIIISGDAVYPGLLNFGVCRCIQNFGPFDHSTKIKSESKMPGPTSERDAIFCLKVETKSVKYNLGYHRRSNSKLAPLTVRPLDCSASLYLMTRRHACVSSIWLHFRQHMLMCRCVLPCQRAGLSASNSR